MAEYGGEQPGLHPENKDYVTVGGDGAVTVSVPGDETAVSAAGSPVQGQVDSKAVEKMMALDQTDLAGRLGGKKVAGWGTGGSVMIGSTGTAYPGRVMRPGDPSLAQKALKSQKKVFSQVESGLMSEGMTVSPSALRGRRIAQLPVRTDAGPEKGEKGPRGPARISGGASGAIARSSRRGTGSRPPEAISPESASVRPGSF